MQPSNLIFPEHSFTSLTALTNNHGGPKYQEKPFLIYFYTLPLISKFNKSTTSLSTIKSVQINYAYKNIFTTEPGNSLLFHVYMTPTFNILNLEVFIAFNGTDSYGMADNNTSLNSNSLSLTG